jgi:GH15 family glucan-1,4-alpha-glucosidase
VTAAFSLGEGQSATFVLRVIVPDAHPGRCPGTEEAEDWFRQTVNYWQRWAARSTYRGRWREVVLRSALALKLLTYQPTGAIVAAPTTSLPEGIGGVRNWDYRYTWIRDAAFTVYAFLRVGFTEEAAGFRDWLAARYKERDSHCDGPLQLMYAVDGRSDLAEQELTHLDPA